jgi:hypothetical protein
MEHIVISVSVSVDVPSLEEAIRFYGEAFGSEKVSESYPGVALIRSECAPQLLDERISILLSGGMRRHIW